MRIFISHSRRDQELVSRLERAISVLGNTYQSVVYENLPEFLRDGPDWQNIQNLIMGSDVVFLLMTRSVEDSLHTRAWVEHEAAVASAFAKPLVVYQIAGSPPRVPITYWTAVAVIDPERPEGFLQIQTIAKAYGAVDIVDDPLARSVAGGAAGSIAGPLGTLVGAVVGWVSAPPHPLSEVPLVTCGRCGANFRYWGVPGSSFHCPHCLIAFEYQGG